MGYPKSDNTWEPADNVQAPRLIKQYHRRHPLVAIKATTVEQTPHQPSWVADAPNSVLNERDLRSPTSTSPPCSAHMPTRPINSQYSNPIYKGTSCISITPKTLTFAANEPAPFTDNGCLTKYQMSHPSPLT